jgi:hypothetical protein
MKLNLVKDEKGKVIATFENPVSGGPSVRPILKAGHKILEVDADESYKKNITAFYERHSK